MTMTWRRPAVIDAVALAALILVIIGAMAGPWAGRLSPVMRVWPVAYAA